MIFPAICQIVLKRRSSSSSQKSSQLPAYTPHSIPFISDSANKTTPSPFYPINNNFSTPTEPRRSECGGGDVETGNVENTEQSKESRTLIEIYLWVLSWKWYTVRKCSLIPNFFVSYTSTLCRGVYSVHFNFQGLAFLLYLSWMIFSGLGALHLRLGLPIADVVPSNSSEWKFLTAQMDLFPVYHIRAVTKANFDYPNNQK